MYSNDRLRHYYAEQLQAEAPIPSSWARGFWAGFGFAFVLNMCLWLMT